MTQVFDFNRALIDEFRANDGKVKGPFEGAPLLLLTTTGAQTGREHTTPVVYQFEKQKAATPGFADYERKTARQIPVVALERVSRGATRV
jgi:hypothetical protein